MDSSITQKSWKTFALEEMTPIIKQYLDVKKQHEDCIVFFRIGDFYEIFFEDSEVASKHLGILLTRKAAGGGEFIPMCGVPVHSYETYLSRLVKEGHKVAICEQLETPTQAKKRGAKAIVNRQVARVITKGTLIEDTLLDSTSYNYLVAIHAIRNTLYIAWIDISTGDFYFEKDNMENIASILYKINAKEILISEKISADIRKKLNNDFYDLCTLVSANKFNYASNYNILSKAFENQAFFLDSLEEGDVISCGVLIDYIYLTQKNISKLPLPKRKTEKDSLRIDIFTRKSLEITINAKGGKDNTLKSAIDLTLTNLGSRQLSHWLNNPLINVEEINQRLDAVDFLVKNSDILKNTREILKNIPDFERALSRILFKRASALDLVVIRTALEAMVKIRSIFFKKDNIPPLLKELISQLGFYGNLIDILKRALMPYISIKEKDSGFIMHGYDGQFDGYKRKKDALLAEVENLQEKYCFMLAIANLKITFSNIQGYAIEVPNKNAASVLEHKEFTHKQSTATTTKYMTADLREIEGKINTIDLAYASLEQEIFARLCDLVVEDKNNIHNSIKAICGFDILCSFAEAAITYNFCRPIVNDTKNINIKNGRHFVVEKSILHSKKTSFIPNDCLMDKDKYIFLITGPNMAGKSTFLRQNALMIIMAQVGSFVPADYAEIGVVDAIFSRVGASDDLSSGQSTFMVEMMELATILSYATDRSFLILDEIGRGTATYDGLSIAWATLEYLNNTTKSRTLFATHYHELTELNKTLNAMECYYVKIKEHEHKIIFMHLVVKGMANKSYGIEVGKLAGLPNLVIKRAKQILLELENKHKSNSPIDLLSYADSAIEDSLMDDNYSITENNNAFNAILNELIDEITGLNLDEMSPKQALDAIYSLKQKVLQAKNN